MLSLSNAQFDWGGDCSDGAGSFDVSVPTRATLLPGTIPDGKSNVLVELNAARDLDIVLVDVSTGTEIVA